ncbi:hypothetical protein K9L97_03670 [Candidatus Woesearchaeota archaeon]|nr:hypothetical protein [Candidatus Woesearchaeota archaeon]
MQEANKVAPYAEMPHSETTATSSRGVVKLHIGERIPIEDSVNGEVRLNIVN